MKEWLKKLRSVHYRRILGIEGYDEDVRSFIEKQNLQLGAPVSLLTMVISGVMLIRQAVARYSPIELSFYVLLLFGSILMFMTFLISSSRSGDAPVRHTTVVVYLYLITFLIYEVHVSVGQYVRGGGAMIFTIMVVVGFMLFNLRPITIMVSSAVTFLTIALKVQEYGQISNRPQEYIVTWLMIALVAMVRYYYTMEAATHSVDNRRTNERLQSISRTDALTGLNNRYALREDFDGMIGRRMEVMICDIDNFKHVNDTYGHNMGDEVLKRIASLAAEHFEETVVYRYGGDEFMLISTQKETDFHREVRDFMTRFHKCVFPGGPENPTCSCGYVFGFAESAEDLRAMFSQADELLYQAKQSGKYTMKCHAFDFTLKDIDGKGQRLFK